MELICPMQFNPEGRKGQSGEVVSYDAYGRIVGAPQEKTSDVTPPDDSGRRPFLPSQSLKKTSCTMSFATSRLTIRVA